MRHLPKISTQDVWDRYRIKPFKDYATFRQFVGNIDGLDIQDVLRSGMHAADKIMTIFDTPENPPDLLNVSITRILGEFPGLASKRSWALLPREYHDMSLAHHHKGDRRAAACTLPVVAKGLGRTYIEEQTRQLSIIQEEVTKWIGQ